MNKRTVFAIALMILGIMGACGFGTAHAASLPASQVLGSQNVTLIESTLAAMQDFLNMIQFRINDAAHPLTDGQKIALDGTLEGMKTSLIGISTTIGALEAQAMAAQGTSEMPFYGTVPQAETVPQTATIPPQETDLQAAADDGASASALGEKNSPSFESMAVSDVSSNIGAPSGKMWFLWGIVAVILIVGGGTLLSRMGNNVQEDDGSETENVSLKDVAQNAPPVVPENPEAQDGQPAIW